MQQFPNPRQNKILTDNRQQKGHALRAYFTYGANNQRCWRLGLFSLFFNRPFGATKVGSLTFSAKRERTFARLKRLRKLPIASIVQTLPCQKEEFLP
jgi:hypothetical protein